MVKFYVLQVKIGKIKVEDIPERWRKQVEDSLE
jgi:hypothetical protein